MDRIRADAVSDLEVMIEDLDNLVCTLENKFDLPFETHKNLRTALSSLESAFAVIDDLSLD